MIKDRVAFDLPAYDGLLAGHYLREQGYSRRRQGGTDDWLLVMTLAGEGRFGSPVGELVVGVPMLALISPGTTHDYGTSRTAEMWEILWVHFQPPSEWLELLAWPLAAPGIHTFDPPEPQEIESAFRNVVHLSTLASPRRRWRAMNALERLLLLCDSQRPVSAEAMDSRVRAAVEFIHHHLAEELGVSGLASRANLSVSRFAHLFRAETGLSPMQYVMLQRLERGRVLLERTALGVSEVASAVGMDPFYFSSRFRAHFGKSPAGIRTKR